MSTHSRFILSIVAILMLAVAGCGDDDGAGPVDQDKTPPAVTSVTAIDAMHIDVVFSEKVTRTSAEELANYAIVEVVIALAPAAPGDTLHLSSASLKADQMTVALTTAAPMQVVDYAIGVHGVKDLAGNSIQTPVVKTFTGSTDADTTPPQLVSRYPAPNATNVPVTVQVTLQFSEPVTSASFFAGFKWSTPSGPVPFLADSPDNGVHVIVSPQNILQAGVKYDLALIDIQDLAGNTMPTVVWSFTTTTSSDNTPPTFVSSDPADGATRVSIHNALSLTFSEAINQSVLDITVTPDIGDGTVAFTNSGKTFVFTPNNPLLADQQYNVLIPPDGVYDLAGNGIATPVFIQFTTGNALATGHISGTISGDPQSSTVTDPTGAYVIAATANPLATDFWDVGAFDIVAGNNTYNLSALRDGYYFPFSIIDSNKDGMIDPSTGDAIGLWGVDIRGGDMSADSVTIFGGNHVSNVNFPLFDPSAITGSVAYSGIHSVANVFVALFDGSLPFDPTATPLVTTTAFWPNWPEWGFHTVDGMPDGTYYVAAFLDANWNDIYDPDYDPAGVFGGTAPTKITVQHGTDFNGLVIPLDDPSGGPMTAQAGIRWPEARPGHGPALKQMGKLIEAQLRQGGWK